MSFLSGYIAIIGRPNAGKSTLLNTILQKKIAITTPKAQTTRDNIAGILHQEDAQFIFIDTPGIHKPKHQLGKSLNHHAYNALYDCDILLYLVDSSKSFGKGDAFLLERLQIIKKPVFLVLNKIDILSKSELVHTLDTWQTRFTFNEIFPISALENNNVSQLISHIKKYLPKGVPYFEKTTICDHDENFQFQEIIREQILYMSEEEIPHAIAVIIEDVTRSETRCDISAVIVVERMSQKAIIIGKQANLIRKIRLKAQKELKAMLHRKVNLELYVRVEKNWRNRPSKLKQLGYHEDQNV